MSNRNFREDYAFPVDVSFVSAQPIPAQDLWLVPTRANGSPVMAVNGSGAPISFRATVPRGNACFLLRLVFVLSDSAVRPERFGDLPALTNGVVVSFKNANEEVLFGGVTAFKQNRDWLVLAGDKVAIWNPLVGSGVMAFEWPVYALGYAPMLEAGSFVEVLVQDDLSNLEMFQCMVTGRLVRP